MTTDIEVEVLVSGAGPVGLFFAYQMASRGHSVCIVDPKPGATDQSRAVLITARSMEILQNKGLAAEILYQSFAASGMRLYNNGKIAAEVDAGGDTCFPQNTGVTQAYTEKIILNHIEKFTNLKVDWNTELISYTQDENNVTAIIRNVNTKEERVVKSIYIVGADGTHSKVRKGSSDWTYEGVAINTKLALADLTLKGKDAEILRDKVNIFTSGSTDALVIIRVNPMVETGKEDAHVFRVIGNLETYSRDESMNKANTTHGIIKTTVQEGLDLEFIRSWVCEKTHLELECSNLRWTTYFKINERMANGYRRKRAFVIGDAGHCHSPFGGQGMNLGLQDADNLAWKMSDVLKSISVDPETLLDSYSAERMPHAKATIDATSAATKLGIGANPWVAYFRNLIGFSALKLPQVRATVFRTAMQLQVTIESDSKILGTSSKGLIQPGQFFPDSGNLRKSLMSKANIQRLIQRNTIHEVLIDNKKSIAIFVGTCFSGSKPNTHLMEKFWKDTRFYPVRRLIIQSPWHSHDMKFFPEYILEDEQNIAEESFYCEELMETSNSVTSRVGLLPLLNSYFASSVPPSVLVFVRPDLYVTQATLIHNENDLDEALQFLSSNYISLDQ